MWSLSIVHWNLIQQSKAQSELAFHSIFGSPRGVDWMCLFLMLIVNDEVCYYNLHENSKNFLKL